VWNNGKVKSLWHAPWLLTLKKSRGVCWSSGMGLGRETNSFTHSHKLAPNQQISWLTQVRAPLVLGWVTGNLRLTRLTTAQIWGKPWPSPIYYTLHLPVRVAFKWLFVPGLSSESPEIVKVRTFATLQVHNFLCKPLIRMRSKPKLQPSSRSFQRCVACHLHAM
jgi:hypothetical protein